MKVALVTGGRVRLGAAISAFLKKSGWRVLTSSHRADAGADIVADLADPLGAARLYSAALDILGGRPPDALVNNAAILSGDGVETVNFESAQKLVILMAGRETGRGSVVNILDASDQSARFPAYAKSKEMLRDYTLKSMAVPQTVIDLASEISNWQAKYGGVDSEAMSPFNSENFGPYSYSKGSVSGSSGSENPNSWQAVYGARLAPFRRLRGIP